MYVFDGFGLGLFSSEVKVFEHCVPVSGRSTLEAPVLRALMASDCVQLPSLLRESVCLRLCVCVSVCPCVCASMRLCVCVYGEHFCLRFAFGAASGKVLWENVISSPQTVL